MVTNTVDNRTQIKQERTCMFEIGHERLQKYNPTKQASIYMYIGVFHGS